MKSFLNLQQLEAVIKGLLRSYEGIFDFPATIYETQLAKFIQKKLPELIKELQQLNQLGIVEYSPRKDKPQITLLQNRMYADSFVINLTDYLQRKQNFEKRIESIYKYIQQINTCRSQLIASYFNDRTIKKCGICDNCINQNDVVISIEEFENIAAKIFQHLAEKPILPDELMKKLANVRKEKFWKVTDYLQAEKKIHFNKEGKMQK